MSERIQAFVAVGMENGHLVTAYLNDESAYFPTREAAQAAIDALGPAAQARFTVEKRMVYPGTIADAAARGFVTVSA